jgi:serine/threonine-protein kinase
VVVKLLRPELSAGVSVERFRREILTAASLQHPLIVPVLDTGEIDGLPYFLMPFVEGESLRTRLERGTLSVVETVRILRDVARALAVAHARGVVHRDIKPDNVLLANDAAVVADFGVSKAFSMARHGDRAAGALGASSSVTTAGVSLGTPAYMAPEQVAADPGASFPMDLYAVGVMAYEMLTGAPPFTGRSPQQIMAAHVAEAPLPLQDKRPELPVALVALVMQCLEKDPTRRPAGATALVQALDDPQVISGSFTPIPDFGSGTMRSGGASGARAFAGASDAPRRSRGPRRAAIIGSTLAVMALAAVLIVQRSSVGNRASATNALSTVGQATPLAGAPPAIADTSPSVAVLPFVYLGAEASQAYTAQAIGDAIADGLTRERGLRVHSRTASQELQRRMAAGDSARLPVRTFVEGVVETEGDRIRLTVRLVNAADGFTIYADRVEGERGKLFAMEDAVALAMRELLRSHFNLAQPDSANAATR